LWHSYIGDLQLLVWYDKNSSTLKWDAVLLFETTATNLPADMM